MSALESFWTNIVSDLQSFGLQFYENIIAHNRWNLFVNGFKNTILITLGAAILGIVLGCLVAICKVSVANQKKALGHCHPLLRILNVICDIYLTIIRGTPMMVQLLIAAFVIFVTVPFDKMIYVAMLAFGINSGAYVAEIIRAGIQAVNIGQTEAGRSLGLTQAQTMRMIVLPQAVRNILPALVNEAIVLLKETAIVGYIAVRDITYVSTLIRSRTFSAIPLLFIACVYLLVVLFMTYLLRRLERRLAKSDRR